MCHGRLAPDFDISYCFFLNFPNTYKEIVINSIKRIGEQQSSRGGRGRGMSKREPQGAESSRSPPLHLCQPKTAAK